MYSCGQYCLQIVVYSFFITYMKLKQHIKLPRLHLNLYCTTNTHSHKSLVKTKYVNRTCAHFSKTGVIKQENKTMITKFRI